MINRYGQWKLENVWELKEIGTGMGFEWDANRMGWIGMD